MNTKTLTRIAMIAAVYTVVSLVLTPFTYRSVQVRIAEALCSIYLGSHIRLLSDQFDWSNDGNQSNRISRCYNWDSCDFLSRLWNVLFSRKET